MHSLAYKIDYSNDIKNEIFSLAENSRYLLPDSSYSSKMYDFVKKQYDSGISWEEARDKIYYRYQVNEEDGYDITSRNLYCNGCFAAGINFAASLISLFWGEGDLKKTIKIGTLMGWDSDNPTSTWGGLIGFIMGKKGIEEEFDNMAEKGIKIISRLVINVLGGSYDIDNQMWYIPVK